MRPGGRLPLKGAPPAAWQSQIRGGRLGARTESTYGANMTAVNLTLGDDGILVATIDVPGRPMNVVGDQLMEGIQAAVDKLADPAVKGLILTSGKADFCAGGDLDRMSKWTTPQQPFDGSMALKAVMRKLETQGKPVVAAINGHALGGGLEIALACHARIAIDDPKLKIGQPEVKLGLLPGGGGTQRLPRLVGKGRALQLILSGETISAQEAYRIGLVNDVVPAPDLISRAESILKAIAANAPVAVKLSLDAVNKGLDTSQSEGFALESSYFGLCAATEDKKEGTSAFLEKRAPQFHGQ